MATVDPAAQGTRHSLSWEAASSLARSLAASLSHRFCPARIYGVPRGGAYVAAMLGGLGLTVVSSPEDADAIVDDIVDSGATKSRYAERFPAKPFLALVDKTSPGWPHGAAWVEFPWERESEADPTDNVRRLLQMIGEDPDRDGLRDTPARVCRALREMTSGYGQDVGSILGRVFDVPCDELIVVRDIAFTSLCEHHLLPFCGTVDVGYLPGQVVGLSKIARLVDALSRRLQVQERLTKQIAEAIETHLSARGVGVVVRGQHACMSCRGVRKSEAVMVTSSMLGLLREEPAARAEFLALCRGD